MQSWYSYVNLKLSIYTTSLLACKTMHFTLVKRHTFFSAKLLHPTKCWFHLCVYPFCFPINFSFTPSLTNISHCLYHILSLSLSFSLSTPVSLEASMPLCQPATLSPWFCFPFQNNPVRHATSHPPHVSTTWLPLDHYMVSDFMKAYNQTWDPAVQLFCLLFFSFLYRPWEPRVTTVICLLDNHGITWPVFSVFGVPESVLVHFSFSLFSVCFCYRIDMISLSLHLLIVTNFQDSHSLYIMYLSLSLSLYLYLSFSLALASSLSLLHSLYCSHHFSRSHALALPFSLFPS